MRVLLTACGLILIVLATAVFAGDRVVARVGSEAVTYRELNDAISQNPELTREKTLDLLIERRLVLVWAAGKNISVRDAEVDEAVRSIRERNNLTADQFKAALESRGESVDIFKANLREQLTINKALGRALSSRVQINEEELQEQYVKTYPRKTVFTVSHILLTVDKGAPAEKEAQVREKAEEILADINAGSSFDGMALKHSQDTTTAKEGGRLGTFSEGELLPELEKLAASLEAGEVGGPVRTSAGYHLLLLESKDVSEPPPLAEVRNSLERSLMAQKEVSVRNKWLKELKETTYIEVFPDDG